MAEVAPLRIWLMRAVFVALALGVMLYALLPLNVGAPAVPGPDLILCLAIAWVLRRPDILSAPLIAGTILLADFLLMRPPGLWALIVLIGIEVLRRRAMRSEPTAIILEMGIATLAIAAMMLAQRVMLSVFFVDRPALVSEVLHFLSTVAAYPFVALLSVYVLGIRAHSAEDGRTGT